MKVYKVNCGEQHVDDTCGRCHALITTKDDHYGAAGTSGAMTMCKLCAIAASLEP